MLDSNLLSITGDIHNRKKYFRGEVIISDNGTFYLSQRDPKYSEKKAIEEISQFGIVSVNFIGPDYILQPYVHFEHMIIDCPEKFGYLLRKIHEKSFNGLPLVHGDFSSHNTTVIEGNLRCFDFEFSHFGNTYADIGRVILRECKTIDDVERFFFAYSKCRPSNSQLKNGLSFFCDWQHFLRKRKCLAYQNVPLQRKKQIMCSKGTFKNIINAFKNV